MLSFFFFFCYRIVHSVKKNLALWWEILFPQDETLMMEYREHIDRLQRRLSQMEQRAATASQQVPSSQKVLSKHMEYAKVYSLYIIPEAEVIICEHYQHNFNKLAFWTCHPLTGCLLDSLDLFVETSLIWIKPAWFKMCEWRCTGVSSFRKGKLARTKKTTLK